VGSRAAAAARPASAQQKARACARVLVLMLTADATGSASAPKVLHREITSHIRWLEARLKERDRDSTAKLRGSPLWQEKEDLLRGVPGVVRCCAPRCWPTGRTGPASNRREVAKLAGVAPLIMTVAPARPAHGVGERAPVRACALHGDLSAVRFQPGLKAFYRRLRSAGKPPKLALTAAMRKPS